jgi:lipid II:glycine glycyltransferase (peptidoglycan interpeptide bridge formation enzyme)
MGLKWKIVSSERDYEDWRALVNSNEHANFLHNENRSNSYMDYGFDSLLVLGVSDDKVVSGALLVRKKIWLFSITICVGGLIVDSSVEKENGFVKAFQSFYEFLVTDVFCSHGFFMCVIPSVYVTKIREQKFKLGKPLRQIATYKGGNIIDLRFEEKNNNDVQTFSEYLIGSFTKKGRRDVRASIRNGMEFRIVDELQDVKDAYYLIEENAANAGYSVRPWSSFGNYILQGLSLDTVNVGVAEYKGRLVGAILLETGGETLCYTMGAAKRSNPDILTGYFLQYSAMIFAKSKGFKFYDISFGGPPSVRKFKGNFNPAYEEKSQDMYLSHGMLGSWVAKTLLSSLSRNVMSKFMSYIRK